MAQAIATTQAKSTEPSITPPRALSNIPFQVLLILGDLLVAGGAFLLAYRLRMLGHFPDGREALQLFNPLALLETASWEGFRPYWHLFLIAPVIRIITLRLVRLYDLTGEFSLVDDLTNIVKSTTLGSLVLIVIAFMYRGGFEFREFSYSRGVFLLDWGLALVGLIVSRGLVRGIQTYLRRRGLNLIPSVVVGQGELAALCCAEMAARPQLGYRIVGIVAGNGDPTAAAAPVLGGLTELPEIITRTGAEEVFITDPSISPRILFETILKSWRHRRTKFSLVPNLLNTLPRKTDIDQIGTLPMIKLFQEPLRGPSRYLKRAADILMAAVGLILLSPILGLIYLLIKLDSPGPALFHQERVGMDGRMFKFYKFRTMHTDADDDTHRQHMSELIGGAVTSDGQELYGKVPGDERVTRVGRILRRYSLDELPQLINILKGEMSVVGPRPPIPYEVEQYSDWHRKRLEVKPGLTGLWQVSGRNRLPFDKMIELDIYYIENWSLWLDVKIILRTLPAILRGETS